MTTDYNNMTPAEQKAWNDDVRMAWLYADLLRRDRNGHTPLPDGPREYHRTLTGTPRI